ncbi:MAG: hypothetical protein FWF60_02770 [Oscillospiraceae bacterium]|nr:hypothetical protein [Oscillospiraceae bacterium]
MSILAELDALVTGLGLPVETGVFSGKAPEEYIVVTPLTDTFPLHCDNRPEYETQEVRLSLFCRGNYLARKKQIVKALIQAGFTITDRHYAGREDDTGYHNYAIDVAQTYRMED